MSNDTNENSVTAPPNHPPNPWLRVLIGLAVCAVACGFCTELVRRYLASRPVDLRAHTTALSDVAEQLLLNLNVPKEKILRAESQLREEPSACWFSTTLDVELVPGIPIENIAEPIKRDMSAQSVSVAEGKLEGGKQELTFSLLDHPFLSMSLTEKPLADFTATSNQIADEVTVILQTQGIAAKDVWRAASETRQDDSCVWTFTRIEAPLPFGAKLEDLEKMIRGALTANDVRVEPKLGMQGTTVVQVIHKERLCAELSFTREETLLADDQTSIIEWPSIHGNGESQNMPVPEAEELPLDSTGLDAMELGRKLTGIKYPGSEAPKVAILVDDGGYGGPVMSKVLALSPKLTVAVLPYTPAARETARKAAELGFEVMLHCPMEPAKMKGCFTTKMSRQEILKALSEQLEEIPEATGVNNHVGSTFTADGDAVKIFLEGVKDRSLFFIDSRTTAKSKAYETAKQLGIPTAMRDVFLDNEPDANYIIGQFNHLMDVAKERGTAIGICHFRTATLPVLTQMLPQLERNGIALVHVSELLKIRQENSQ